MPVVMVDDVALTIRLSLPERVLAVRWTDVVVPRGCVVRCFSVDEPWPLLRGLRWPGLALADRVAAAAAR